MKRLTLATVSVLALAAAPLLAEGNAWTRRPRVVQRPGSSFSKEAPAPESSRPLPIRSSTVGTVETKAAAASNYDVQLNIVTRVQGTSFFRTAVDVTNNTTTNGVVANLQYCYTLNGTYQGCTAALPITLLAMDNFHTDDIVQYLSSQIPPAAANASFGTLLVKFSGLPSGHGWEATATGRTYSPVDQANPSAGTVAIAYPASLFFESSSGSLVGIMRDTRPAPTDAGALRTNLGLTNTALFDTTNPVQVQLVFYDATEGSTTSGQEVGNRINKTLQPGEVTQISDIYTAAAIPSNVLSVIVFADVLGPVSTTTPPTIEGYINILDGGTQDGAFFEMKCATGCANF